MWRRAGLLLMLLVSTGCLASPLRTAPSPSDREVTAPPGMSPSSQAPRATADSGPLRGPLRVVAFGDSVMAGVNCSCAGLVREFGSALSRRTSREVHAVNYAGNGFDTGDVLEQVAAERHTRAGIARADLVLITIGANDLYPALRQWLSGPCGPSCYDPAVDQMGSRLGAVLRTIRALRPRRMTGVLVTTYWNVFTDGIVARRSGGLAQVRWSRAVTTAANRAICLRARQSGARCVDLVPPFMADGDKDPTPLLAADGDHPNALGVRRIVRALLARTPTRALRGSEP